MKRLGENSVPIRTKIESNLKKGGGGIIKNELIQIQRPTTRCIVLTFENSNSKREILERTGHLA